MVRMTSEARGHHKLPQLLTPTVLGSEIGSHDVLELASQSHNDPIYQSMRITNSQSLKEPKLPTNEKITDKTRLFPKTPIVYINSAKEAHSEKLFKYCNNAATPVVIIRGICNALGLDLKQFTTRALVEKQPKHGCEVRTQVAQVPEINRDPNTKIIQWHTQSTKSFSTVGTYAKYQVQSYMATKDRKRKYEYDENVVEMNKMIKFGTNVDLSSHIWTEQINEINKLPDWLRLNHHDNPLSQVGYKILGMNTVQLYMKVLGSRTPGHQENLNMPAVNINIGPEDTEWFCTPEKYWVDICRLCKKHGIDYLSGSWWPDLKELEEAGIPVMRLTQRPGDLVWLNSGTVHWVQATGWCNNVAWNVGPFNEFQYVQGIERYEFNKITRFQSLIPMLHLTFQIAKRLAKTKIEPGYRLCLRHCMQRTLWRLQADLIRYEKNGLRIVYQPRETEHSPPNYCEDCEAELFCVLFVKLKPDKDDNGVDLPLNTYCESCSIGQCPQSVDMSSVWIVLRQFHLEQLGQIYDNL